MPTINNEWYEENAEQWWEEGSLMSILQSLNPGRLTYLDEIMAGQSLKAAETRILDIGCGGGYMTEELAKKGFVVSGVDPSPGSVASAKRHAEEVGFDVEYKVGRGEDLPFEDRQFDMVSCCDVLEHVSDLPKVISEISRVLKPDGIFFYDTINKTALSWLLLIKLAQDLPLVRMVPKDTHVWNMFIEPTRLSSIMRNVGLVPQSECGFGPQKLLGALPQLLKYKLGMSSPTEMGHSLMIGPVRNKSLLYMGWSNKSAWA
ncbi:MAG: bifunctional 2-polyprenyl-6-hydroxyphenol methylase/3-demethylubiquinol 3-O-methyltransferase UbiG [Pseudomonadales bacterium]|nr:bifunctional 2-polyprenyl-6-hydroxyphenol methylase/3-demethylubiquinol 3-O-methyltransferase UbiG [Pseudomonadales bacterium]